MLKFAVLFQLPGPPKEGTSSRNKAVQVPVRAIEPEIIQKRHDEPQDTALAGSRTQLDSGYCCTTVGTICIDLLLV